MGSNPLSKDAITFKGDTFIPVVLGKADGPLFRFSQSETKFLYKFLDTLDLSAACKEIGITEKKGKAYLSRKHIKQFIEQKSRERALAAGLTLDNHMAWLKEVRDEVTKPSESALEASKQIARLLRPADPRGVQVSVQTNVSIGQSPFNDVSSDELIAMMEKRLKERPDVIEGRVTSPSGGG